jgi:hypothetical protein
MNFTNKRGGFQMASIDVFKTTVALIDAIIWPIVILILVWIFRTPIRDILKQLPKKISQATQLSVGNFSLAIRTRAIELGRPEIAEPLSSLSQNAVRQLLQTSPDADACMFMKMYTIGKKEYYFLPPEEELSTLFELQDNRFIEFRENLDEFIAFYHDLPVASNSETSDLTHPVLAKKLSKDDNSRIFMQSYKMTDLGRAALDTIIDVTVNYFEDSKDDKKGEELD